LLGLCLQQGLKPDQQGADQDFGPWGDKISNSGNAQGQGADQDFGPWGDKISNSSNAQGQGAGRDILPMEFFQENSEDVAPTLLQAYKAMLELGDTSKLINKGLITLIPKFGDCSRLRNWCTITLLGSIYKILAKVLFQIL